MTDTITPETVTGELVPAGRQTIFDIPDTATQLAMAEEQATAVTKIIDTKRLSMKIGRSEHVLFEGWATLGAFNGLSVHTVWTKALEDGTGWEARAEVRTLDGRVVGTADAMCSRAERNWAKADDYAIRSMAQTRAGSKAFKGPLSWVMVLAGKSPTPAEEIADTPSTAAAELPGWAEPYADVGAVAAWLVDILNAANVESADTRTAGIGQAIFDECANAIPKGVATTIHHIHQAVTAPHVSSPTNKAPAAADGTNGDTA